MDVHTMAVTLSIVLLVAGTCSGTEYSLLKSDDSAHRSFLTNPGGGYGWSSEADPEKGNTYLVNGGRDLYTPSGSAGETLTFVGDRLTLDYGNLFIYAGASMSPYKEVVVNDLALAFGDVSTYGSFNNYLFKLSGAITVDSSRYSYASGLVRILAKTKDTLQVCSSITASEHETVVYRGAYGLDSRINDMFDAQGNKQFAWKTYYNKMQTHLLGDNSQNFSTNTIQYGLGFYIGCPVLPGTINMRNASFVTMDSSVITAAVGAVFARDGYLLVPPGKSLSAASLDFDYADASTYLINGINVYTGLGADVPYEPSHTCHPSYGTETCYLNAIEIANNSKLSAPKARLSDTLVKFGTSAALTVGDAELSNVTLSGSGLLAVTNSLAISKKVCVVVNTTRRETTFISLPVGKGELSADDFIVQEGINPCQYRLFVTVEDGLQLLRCRNLNCGTFDGTTGYVYSTAGSGYFSRATNWSDGQAPHSHTNYYIGYSSSTLQCENGGVFQGDSVTLGQYRFSPNTTKIRVPDHVSVTEIDDLILLPYCEGMVAWGDSCATTYRGRMTFLTTAGRPFRFQGEGNGQAYVIESELYGWTNAVIEASAGTAPSSVAPGKGVPRTDFVGVHENYQGVVRIGTNEVARIGGDGFPNARVELMTAYAITKTYPTAGKTYSVKCLALTDSAGYVEVAEDTSLKVGSLALLGRLEKSGTGRLVVTGTAEAGTGAELKMNAGTLQVTSSSALSGTALTIAEGAVLAVKYPGGAVVAAESATLPSTMNVVVEADAEALVADKPTIPFLTIPTPANDPVFKFNKPVKGYRFVVQKSVSGGLTTYSAHFDSFGLAIIFR